MPIYTNGKKAKELWFQGRKIKEAWYNGQKVFSGVREPRQATITGVSAGFLRDAWDITSVVGDKSIFSQLSSDRIGLAVPVRLTAGAKNMAWTYNGEVSVYPAGEIIPAGATSGAKQGTFTFVEVI